MGKITLFTVLLTILGFAGFSQQKDFSALVELAVTIPVQQTKTIEQLSEYIAAHAETTPDRLRMIYTWLAGNINYDVERLRTRKHFKNDEEKIARLLADRKGVCEDYALVFVAVCKRLQIPAYLVVGYTRQAGEIGSLPHGWCAAQSDNEWYLFDPTWAAGYVGEDGFQRRFSARYFMVQPQKMAATHMPFDPMFQFVSHPLTAAAFISGEMEQRAGFFNYRDSLKVYEIQDDISRGEAVARRIENNGTGHSLIREQLKYVKMEAKLNKEQQRLNQLTEVSELFKSGIEQYNRFIQYRNRRFRPVKSDDELRLMVAIPYDYVQKAKTILGSIDMRDTQVTETVTVFKQSLTEFEGKVREQQRFIQSYLPKSMAARNQMLTR
ncbi:MAG: transglutaminase domain-containing protein [Bacteroidota bacterium]